MADYKKYDSHSSLTIHNARLTEDAKVIKDGFVKLTTVLTSSNEDDVDIWLTIIPMEKDFPTASLLKKGDTFGVTGFLTARVWGEPQKTEHILKFPKMHYPIALLVEMKERGGGVVKPVAKKLPVTMPGKKQARPIINLDDDLDA